MDNVIKITCFIVLINEVVIMLLLTIKTFKSEKEFEESQKELLKNISEYEDTLKNEIKRYQLARETYQKEIDSLLQENYELEQKLNKTKKNKRTTKNNKSIEKTTKKKVGRPRKDNKND